MDTTTTRAAIAALAITATAGCSSSAAPEQVSYETSGTFTMALPGDIGAFDPYRNGSLISFAALAYDSLINISPTGEVISGLAQEWQADAKQAVFTLKEGITCSDGTPLKASQVATDLNFVKDPKNASPLFGTVVPPVPFSVAADDSKRSVTVTMESPYAFLMHTIGVVPIVCPGGMSNPTQLKDQSDGTGPYVLTQVTPGVEYTFAVRKDYAWGPGGATTRTPGTPQRIVAKVITDEATAANLLLSGGLNATGVRSATQQQRLKGHSYGEVTIPMLTGELWFNQRPDHPGSDEKVRRALVTALDRIQLATVATSGQGGPARGLVASDAQPCKGDTVTGHLPAHDARAAGVLLDDAGWAKDPSGARSKDGRPLAIHLRYPTSLGEAGTAAMELIQKEWKNIGIEVTLTGDDPNGVSRTLFQTSDFDAYWNPLAFSLPTQAVPFVSGPPSPNGQNFAAIDNPEYTKNVMEAATVSGPDGCALWHRAEQALFDRSDVVPVAQQPMTVYLNKAEAKSNQFQLLVPTSIRLLK